MGTPGYLMIELLVAPAAWVRLGLLALPSFLFHSWRLVRLHSTVIMPLLFIVYPGSFILFLRTRERLTDRLMPFFCLVSRLSAGMVLWSTVAVIVVVFVSCRELWWRFADVPILGLLFDCWQERSVVLAKVLPMLQCERARRMAGSQYGRWAVYLFGRLLAGDEDRPKRRPRKRASNSPDIEHQTIWGGAHHGTPENKSMRDTALRLAFCTSGTVRRRTLPTGLMAWTWRGSPEGVQREAPGDSILQGVV